MASDPVFVKRKVAPGPTGWALLLALLVGGSTAAAEASAQEAFDLSAYSRVLESYVTPKGQVRYAALKQDSADLQAFLQQLAAVSPDNRPDLFPTPAARMAYWINAYNAFVVHAVVDAYPVKSVRDLRFGFGLLFFKRAKFVAGGKKYSLDDIEHGILRKQFAEPRVHFVVNCASTSCPPLARRPFRAETLDEQLEQAARDFITNEQNVWMRGDVLFLSKIFDWYQEDFLKALARQGVEEPTVADYVVRYLPEETAERIRMRGPRVEFYSYDWSLNDAAPRPD